MRRAAMEGVSLNTMVVTLLAAAMGQAEAVDRADRAFRGVVSSWRETLFSALTPLARLRSRVTSGNATVQAPSGPQDPLLQRLYRTHEGAAGDTSETFTIPPGGA